MATLPTKLLEKTAVIVVFGSTAVGKSKLGVSLAEKFHGEVISADSMQIYKGLDILTNKVTEDEVRGVPHHMLGFLEPGTEYRVGQFRDRALEIIGNLHEKGKIPVIVGGTNYYIESLIWKVLVDASVESGEVKIDLSPEETFERLKEVDPEMAGQLHPNDVRKVARSLQVFLQTGRKHSEVLKDQRSQPGGTSLGGPLRFDKTLFFYLHCDQAVLDERIYMRAEQMVDQGLIEELRTFYDKNAKDKPDFTRGVFQSIGVRQFFEYFHGGEKEDDLKKGVEELKIATRRYARKQRKWVMNRFLRNEDRKSLALFGLDATNLVTWENEVEKKALTIAEQFLAGEPISFPRLTLKDVKVDAEDESSADEKVVAKDKVKYFCDVCDRLIIGSHIWNVHLKSRKHKKVLAKKQRATS